MTDRYTGKRGELNFEDDLVQKLIDSGWEADILKDFTVAQHGPFNENKINSLEGNLRNIINERNRKELNSVPLSDFEFSQIMNVISCANTPVKANVLINGKTVCITRDIDSKDKEHAGKPVYLNIYEPAQVASGTTRYQIARQTHYETGSWNNDRRGDVTLLINGLPVIHIELKARNVDLNFALHQIVKYAKEGVFTGLMGLVQVFFAMNPDDVVYYANFGDYQNFNSAFAFHWADENNNRICDWQQICDKSGKHAMLSIPEAHQLIGFYTVADRQKDVLRVMRSYQVYAVRAIVARTKKQKWGTVDPLGGLSWCTTGGGKTLSSFKAGQLIRDLNLADKVVFLVDRTELNNQSLEDYNSCSREGEEVQGTESSAVLFSKLKSTDTKDALIITSIQKMNHIHDDAEKLKKTDLDLIKKKRIVFIVDEAQRSQYGEMHERVKKTFPTALFFGFTGTPIMGADETDVHDSRSVFGQYISVYTIAAGIRDENVLGFSPKAVKTYADRDLRIAVALQRCNARTEEEAKTDPAKYSIYRSFLHDVEMASSYIGKDGKKHTGIEGYLPAKQYDNDKHRNAVVDYILKNWEDTSRGSENTWFHALLSTSSIAEAIAYYRLFMSRPDCNLHVTALFDPNIDNSGGAIYDKANAITEIVQDYDNLFDTSFDRKNDPDYKGFKADIMARLAHKRPYTNIGQDRSKMIDLLIVVNQLLTGYDSQFINCLYLDNVIEASNLIQAISRTNRVYNKTEKPFGLFRFFRKIYTMQDNLEEALKLYCEGNEKGVVVPDIKSNLLMMNATYADIKKIFDSDNIVNYNRLPKDDADCNEFRKLYMDLRDRLNAVRLQGGLRVKKVNDYELEWEEAADNEVKLEFTSDTYNLLFTRYQDLPHRTSGSGTYTGKPGFSIDTHISEIELEKIDTDYLEKHFKMIIPILSDVAESDDRKEEKIKEFEGMLGKLSARQQVYAKQVIQDIRNGILVPEDGKRLVEYISEYIHKAKTDAVTKMADRYGVDQELLMQIIDAHPTEATINEGLRLSTLCSTCNIQKAMAYYGASEYQTRKMMQRDLKQFILVDVQNI